MARYTTEFKKAIIEKMLPPNAQSVHSISKETGISTPTLYNWRNDALGKGVAAVGSSAAAHTWSDESKLAVVIETAALNIEEQSEYCRSRGLYPEDIERWRAAAVSGQSKSLSAKEREEFRAVKAKLKKTEKELARKEKALAEAAALMVLRKKSEALFGALEDD